MRARHARHPERSPVFRRQGARPSLCGPLVGNAFGRIVILNFSAHGKQFRRVGRAPTVHAVPGLSPRRARSQHIYRPKARAATPQIISWPRATAHDYSCAKQQAVGSRQQAVIKNRPNARAGPLVIRAVSHRSSCSLPLATCLPSTAHFLLLTAYCLLPTSFLRTRAFQSVCARTAAMMIAPPTSAQRAGRSPRNTNTQIGFKTGSM